MNTSAEGCILYFKYRSILYFKLFPRFMAFWGRGDFVIQNLQHLCLLKVIFRHIMQLIPVPTLEYHFSVCDCTDIYGSGCEQKYQSAVKTTKNVGKNILRDTSKVLCHDIITCLSNFFEKFKSTSTLWNK